jgi:uncharacterized protein (TIGR02646 family)
MMEVERTESPQCLKNNYKNWGKEYKQNLDANPRYQHHWHNRRDEIDDALFDMTKNHCSFCDIQPLKQSGATIEHFRPKNGANKFPLLAYVWENLFYCCPNCQKKGTKYSRKLLKPDQVKTYSFKHYFILDETFEEVFIRPNPERTIEEQERAKETITLYGLNKFARPEARKAELKDFREDRRLGKIKDINSYSYRFILH